MTVLSTILNGASNKDIRDTINNALRAIEVLQQGATIPAPTVYFESATISAAEGNSGTKLLTMTLLRSTSVGALAVTANFVPGTAGAADFAGNALPGAKVFTFADGATSATQTVGISGDTDVESDETFGYQLVAPSGYSLGSPNSLTGTILNDDTAALPTVTLSAATSSANEGGAGTTLAWVYTVTRSTSTGTASVPWSFAAGTTDATDWNGGTLPAGGVVNFAAGETSKSLGVISAGDVTFEPDETFTVSITAPSGYAAGSAMSATGTILNDDAEGGNVLPTAALADVAVGNGAYANPYLNLGGLNLPAGDWVMYMAVRLPTNNSYDLPLISIAPTTVASGFLHGNSQLHLAYMTASSSKSSDPARGSLILSGKDDAGNWLAPNSNRSIASYWAGYGTNVRYLAGPYQAVPDGAAESIFIQKSGGTIQLWIVRDGGVAICHDAIGTNFGPLTGQSVSIGRMPGEASRAAGVTFQRFFAAAGSLTPAKMEAIAQGVDPRQYLAFDQASDRLTNWQNVTAVAQPDLVGGGSTTLTGTGSYTVKTSLVPNAVVADMPRVFVEKNQIKQCTSMAVASDMLFTGTCSGLDDDIYLQVVDATTKTTIVKDWTKVARSVNGVWLGTINGDFAKLQWYDLLIRKGTTGTPYTLGQRFGCGIVIDGWGQSLNEKKRMSTGTGFTLSGANFISIYSRAKSDAGSTQGTTWRGWRTGGTTGFGEARLASILADAAQRPVGSAMSAVEGSAFNAWQRGNVTGYEPAADTWRRIRPGFLYWAQGHGNTGTSPQDYTALLDNLLVQTREDFPWSWRFVMEPLCNNGATANNAGSFDAIRKAQHVWADAKAAQNVTSIGNASDLKLVDTVHATPDNAGMGKQAERLARQMLFTMGLAPTSAQSPKATGVAISGVNVDVTFAHNGGATLKAATSGDITGFEVALATDTGFANKLAVASVTVLDATRIRIVLSAAPGAAVRVRYQWGNPGATTTPLDANGYIAGVSNPLYDDRSPSLNTALGFPALFTTADLVSA